MTTTSPVGAMHRALSVHVRARLRAVAGLGASECLDHWPAPTEDLLLKNDRAVVSIVRIGDAKTTRLGGPVVQRVTPGILPAATIRYDFDQIDQQFRLGVWAMTQAMRDDVDFHVHNALNLPYWTTCPPLANTSLVDARLIGQKIASVAIPKPGRYFVRVADMASIWPQGKLEVDAAVADDRETIVVEDITPFGFLATFRKAHGAGATFAEVAARRQYAAEGLSLRCADHYNAVAGFEFGEPRSLDDVEDGKAAQRLEWRSVREGTGSIRHLRDVAGVVQDKQTLTLQAGTTFSTSDASPTPRAIVVFE